MKASPWYRFILVSLAVGAVIYGLLWGITAVWGIREVRAHYESLPRMYFDSESKAVRLVQLDSFDRDRFRGAGKGLCLFYFGRFRTPGPFLVTVEVAEATQEGGHLSQMMFRWWMGEGRLMHRKTLWSFGEHSDLDF